MVYPYLELIYLDNQWSYKKKWCSILKPRCCLTIPYADIWCRTTGSVSITLLKLSTEGPYLGYRQQGDKNGSNTRIGINDNTHLNNVGIYTTCRIRKGTFVCNLPSKKIFDAGDTVELTTRDLNYYVTNICALETIKRRIAPDIKANGSIINWPIPEGGLNNMDHSFYLRHANKGEDANLEFVSSNDSKQIQSQGFDTHRLSRDVDAGVELILPYCELTSKALSSSFLLF